MEPGIVIKMPLRGHISVIATGKGTGKVEAVVGYEKIRPRLKGVFKAWHKHCFDAGLLKQSKKV